MTEVTILTRNLDLGSPSEEKFVIKCILHDRFLNRFIYIYRNSTWRFPDISPTETLTWKSCGSQNKTFIARASPEILYQLWDKKHHRLAKMEYCYWRTESLWYRRQNRHVCLKGKCATDHSSRSTGVDQSRKQKCCSQSYLLSQAHRDTSYQAK